MLPHCSRNRRLFFKKKLDKCFEKYPGEQKLREDAQHDQSKMSVLPSGLVSDDLQPIRTSRLHGEHPATRHRPVQNLLTFCHDQSVLSANTVQTRQQNKKVRREGENRWIRTFDPTIFHTLLVWNVFSSNRTMLILRRQPQT